MSFFKNILWSPLDYEEASFLAREAGEEMLDRLNCVTIKPDVVLDVGAGLGHFSTQLQWRYPEAKVVALDLEESMIQYARDHQSEKILYTGADAQKLPVKNQSVDIIFANFLLPWQEDISSLFREWRRVLRSNGLLTFTSLGPDTLKEWRHLLRDEDIPQLIDMHDLGDLLLKEGFAEPVLDVNHYTVTYRDKEKFVKDLIRSGILALPLTELNLDHISVNDEGVLPVTYEIVYAHAFSPAQNDEVSASEDGVVKIPLSQLRKRLQAK